MKQIKINKQFIESRFLPETINDEKRTIEITWTTGQRGKRSTWFGDSYFEELEVSKKAVRMDRLLNGAPFLDAHNGYSNRAVIGVVETAALDKGKGTAIIRFSQDEDADKLFSKVKEGVLRNVSVGYKVHKYEETYEGKDRVLRAVDWEPVEISLVPIGFDSSATVRSDDENIFECEIIERKIQMENNTVVEPKQTAIDENQIRAAAVEAERKRVAEIAEVCRLGEIDAQKFIAEGVSVDECRKAVLVEMAGRQKQTTQSNIVVGETEGEKNRSGLVNALQFRVARTGLTNTKAELSDNGKRFANMSLLDMARTAVGDHSFGMSKSQVVERAFHSTSDFPLILEDTVRKTLRSAYDVYPTTFEPFTRRTTTPDFKTISRNRLSDIDQLIKTAEGAEYKAGSISEEGEKYKVSKYGRLFQFTREMLINDDMDAFSQIPTKFGRAARRLESDLVWAVITANAAMADGVALFHGSHGNLGTTGTLSETTLSEIRKLMRLQKDLKGEPLNISPVYLAVPAALETLASKILTTISPDSVANVNPFSYLKLIVEPRLDAHSPTAHYVFGDLMMTDILELATLEGEGLDVAREDHMKTDSISWRVRHEVGVAPIDWRGAAKNIGA